MWGTKMSWEEMWRDEIPCSCGKGKIVRVFRMDDWNRTETTSETLCAECRRKDHQSWRAEDRKAAKRRKYRAEAVSLAKSRYLMTWLKTFEGASKKEVWEAIPKSISGYPSLGTFYTHIRHFGSVSKYLEWRFESDIEEFFPARFKDREIEGLLTKANRPCPTR